jgi:hypothetical protein
MSVDDSTDDGDYDYLRQHGPLFDDRYDFDDDEESDPVVRRRNIINGLHESYLQHLSLSDELWTSSVAMESFHPDVESIIVALQSNRSLETIKISTDVLAAIGEMDQGRLFYSVGNLPSLQQMSLCGVAGSTSAIHTRVLAEALSETSKGSIITLVLSGLKISSRSEVEQLARGLKARVESLNTLVLVDTVLDVEDKTGCLDPILLALAPVPGEPLGQMFLWRLSCVEAASNGASLGSPEALGTFFAEIPLRRFILQNLGLNDNHCEVMAQELARGDALLRPIHVLDLSGNPSIGQQGYAALLGLLNRKFDISAVDVDDQNWKTRFELVAYMNRECHRGRFMKNGVFPSKTIWVNFLAELAPRTHCFFRGYLNEDKKLNAIWYTLRENPDWIYSLYRPFSSNVHACMNRTVEVPQVGVGRTIKCTIIYL